MVTTLVRANFETKDAGGGRWSSYSYAIGNSHHSCLLAAKMWPPTVTISMEVIQIKHKIDHLFGSLQKFQDWFKCSWSLELLTNLNQVTSKELQSCRILLLSTGSTATCFSKLQIQIAKCQNGKNKSMLAGISFFPVFLSWGKGQKRENIIHV